MILVDQSISYARIPGVKKPPRSIDACTFLLYPSKQEDYVLRVTGIYLPPSAEVTPNQLETVTGHKYQTISAKGGEASHLIVGDFNPNCWRRKDKVLYHEWAAGAGLWELSDPKKITFIRGNSSLDKFLLRPGTDIPEEWLPPLDGVDQEGVEGGRETGLPFYPAETFSSPWIDDHHPVMLGLGGARDEMQTKSHRKLKIGGLGLEDWQARHNHLEEVLRANKEKFANLQKIHHYNGELAKKNH